MLLLAPTYFFVDLVSHGGDVPGNCDRAKASAEGLAKSEVERTLESVRDFSGERPQSREGEVVAQQVLQERLVMHIAYRPVERRGKMAKEGSVRTLVRSGDSCAVCLVSHSIDLAIPP